MCETNANIFPPKLNKFLNLYISIVKKAPVCNSSKFDIQLVMLECFSLDRSQHCRIKTVNNNLRCCVMFEDI